MSENLSVKESQTDNLLPKLQEAVRLFSLYFRLPIQLGRRNGLPLTGFQHRAVFCEKVQVFYQTEYLINLLNSGQQAIQVLEDPLGTHSILLLIQDDAVLFGPFVTMPYQEKHGRHILSRYLRCDSQLLLHYKLFWSDLSICQPDDVLRAIRTMLEYIGLSTDDFPVHHSQLPKRSARAEEQAGEMELPAWRLHSFQKVEDRYAIETELMMHVAEGNEEAAISALQKLLQTSRPQVGMEVDLWPQQAASAIMRNMIRLAAKRSGLHAAIIDGVCVDYAQKMRQLSGNPIAEAKMYANLISDLCKEIRLMQGNGYSALTQQALFFLHKYYAETFSVGELAQMLHVSESTLSRTLKADTSRSFSQLLKEERMQNAARLLCSTSDSIQTIAGKVGISDPNYFVKVFRSVYRTTPGAYRQNAVLGEAEKLRKC